MNPLVSIVMSVWNDETHLRSCLDSIRRQTFKHFELILINDGSGDASQSILEEFARDDGRLRIREQQNQGLTQALIRGCNQARGAFIARHDADDLSLPGRFEAQVRVLQTNPHLAFVSCWSYGIGPQDELLFEVRRPTDAGEATTGLLARGDGPPGHGSVMFRADAYRQAGGYRHQFRYAQDWDLWLRLVEVGQFACVPQFGYAYRVSEDSISAFRRDQQQQLFQIARGCHAARQNKESEEPWLAEAARISALRKPFARQAQSANSYFIGKCLLDRRDPRAINYLTRSVRAKPWSLRRWFALAAASRLSRFEK